MTLGLSKASSMPNNARHIAEYWICQTSSYAVLTEPQPLEGSRCSCPQSITGPMFHSGRDDRI